MTEAVSKSYRAPVSYLRHGGATGWYMVEHLPLLVVATRGAHKRRFDERDQLQATIVSL